MNIAAALVVKEMMERERIPGTLILWPGVAEEQVATKAHYVRDGIFKDVDVNLFTHVGNNLGVSWGQSGSNALISVLFKFRGQTAHSAGAPWRGKSALDAVMLMAQAWDMKREHLELPQRSHYVIPDGGDQPNVVPQTASIWFYFRERDYPRTTAMFEAAKKMAQGAALMTDTQVDSINIIGIGVVRSLQQDDRRSDVRATSRRSGCRSGTRPTSRWRRASRRNSAAAKSGLETAIDSMDGPVNEATRMGGGSDDIGDISWNMPTVTLRFPSNIPGLPGHNWANGISMATPIAHKGGVAGAKVQAMTLLDILLTPKVVTDAWDVLPRRADEGNEVHVLPRA